MPRASSATSGFFFCGSIELPGGPGVVQADEAELLAREHHDLLPDAREVHREQGKVEQRLRDEVTVADGVEGVLETPPEPQLVGDKVRIDPERRSRERAGTEGRHVHSPPGREHPVGVTGECPAMGQQMVRKQHGLCALQMGVAGQVGIAGARGQPLERALQLEDAPDHASQLPTGEKPQRRCNLIVPASTRVELRPALGRELGHPPLDGRVNVLVRLAVLEGVGPQLVTDLLQGLYQRVRFGVGEDPRPQQTVDVRDRTLHVAAGKPPVEGQACRERHEGVGGGGSHPVGPERHPAPPWRADQVWMPRPNNRTNPSASS